MKTFKQHIKQVLKFLLTTLFGFILPIVVCSQTVSISDAGLKKCLVQNYPSLVNTNSDLIISNAQAFADTLSCVNKSIVDISNLSHFTALKGFKFSNNDIVDATPLANCTKLEVIDLNNNEVEFTPDMSNFTQLQKFSANYNQLDLPPLLPATIQEIYLGNNSLAGTINLNSYTLLKILSVFENDIKILQGIELLTELKRADLYSNELKSPLDLSKLTKLSYLDLHKNKLTTLPILNSSKYSFIGVGENALTFEDFETEVTKPTFSTLFLNYSTQAKLETTETITISQHNSWTWKLNFDQTLTNNTYSWYKNGVFIKNTTTGVFTISDMSAADTGTYYCQVKNINHADFTLTTNTKKILYNAQSSCFEIQNIQIENNPLACKELVNIKITPSLTGNLNGNLTYFLSSSQDTFRSTTGEFQLQKEGVYSLTLQDNSCTKQWAKPIEVTFDYKNCNTPEPYAFSPNNDGIDDEFYIEKSGKAIVFDRNGIKVNEFQTPKSWNGTDSNRNLLPMGLYIILLNNKEKLEVTIIR